MPTSFLFESTMGMPPILFSFISRKASPIVASTSNVMGSSIKPLSLLFTLRTCAACCSMLMFLCKMPRPPSRANAMASAASVTVSIAAESIGILSVILFVNCVWIFTSRGSTSLNAGISNTSSNVKPSPKNFFELEEAELFIVAMSKGKANGQ